jgi:Fe-S-cluster-containing hydrogenase component 2
LAMRRKRRIVQVDEELCDGCGLCVLRATFPAISRITRTTSKVRRPGVERSQTMA